MEILILSEIFSIRSLNFLTFQRLYQKYQMNSYFRTKCNPKHNFENQTFKEQLSI